VSLAQRAVLETSGEVFDFGFFEIGRVGLPLLLAGLLFIFALSGPMLPTRDAAARKLTPSRVYKLTAVVSMDSSVVGKTIEDVGLASIEGCALREIVRDEQSVVDPAPSETLRAGDVLVFAGQVDGITQLMRAPRKRIRKLLEVEQRANRPPVATKQPSEGGAPPLRQTSTTVVGDGPPPLRRFGLAPLWQRWARASPAWMRPSPMPKLVEVVLAPRSRVLGLKSRAFNEAFEATVVAIARDDVPASSMVGSVASHYGIDITDAYMFANMLREEATIGSRLGDVALRDGDSLLLLTSGAFLSRFKTDPAFALINELEKHAPLRRSRAAIAFLLTVAMIAVSIALRAQVSLLVVALVTVGLMLVTGCLTPDEARESFRTDIFLVIGSAFGLSQAMVNSGAAASIARILISVGDGNMSALVVLLYLVTALLTELITNNACVALMFPIAFELHLQDPATFALRPLLYALMTAASASFITPTGYQTNMMVYKPGGYKYMDYPSIGVPLQIYAMGVSCGVILTLDVWYVWVILLAGLNIAFFALARVFPRGCCSPTAYRAPEPPKSPAAELHAHV
jgi:di/tricarboxylate transporter